MKMIAIGTLQHRKEVRARNLQDPRDRGVYKDIMIPPGGEFDTDEIKMSEDEAKDLIQRGRAKRKTKEVADDAPAAGAAGKPGQSR